MIRESLEFEGCILRETTDPTPQLWRRLDDDQVGLYVLQFDCVSNSRIDFSCKFSDTSFAVDELDVVDGSVIFSEGDL